MVKIRKLISKLADRRDLWGNPLKALSSHLKWTRHWRHSSASYLVSADWREGITLALPQTSNSKLAYCGRHPESSVLAAMDEHLAEGAVFVDVGAHVGVYSIIAAKRVGVQGKVFAIEPQSVGIAAIEISATLNGFTNLHAILGAVGRTSGLIPLDLESFGVAVLDQSRAGENSTLVRCLALDDLATENSLEKIHLLKLDAGGNEAEVLLGAKELLRSHQLQAIVMKLYHPDVIEQRFGKTTWDAIAWLHSHGYSTRAVFHGKMLNLESAHDLAKIFSDGSYCHILIAQLR